MKPDPLGLWAPLGEGDLRLVPLAELHREDLRAACAEDPDIWSIYAVSYAPAQFDASFDQLLGNPARLPFAIFAGETLAGMTAWIDPDPKRLSAEIGNTYLRPGFSGGDINGRMKRLLFAHGFACGLKRIQLTVDVRNGRSQAACRKVGATFEGVLRNHMITWTGFERDSAVFSVVERDRERLGL
ncbi:GNAT family protein [Novosphingobium sp.]|uniref:GNAT family N-acetyltransferase n=1 Tax=Novosphingobium sp. TaxID=1874826 RepID=UPI0022C1B17E|nr:GNAT family protein [Novosphingobium sp.]MCZ8019900.1 GNAT family protein [Novosphingobium sp.]MCZ8035774.1 GNAT family protein [Novosphingobium sp.]MCZ8052651.1 GNAT family protein [Novosphingobium sp.]MCZ8060755.1 GNAT family protein [Novosphingobium sp.]MCZ8233327.1 GNAT family protein [Novosphingobium sp.]